MLQPIKRQNPHPSIIWFKMDYPGSVKSLGRVKWTKIHEHRVRIMVIIVCFDTPGAQHMAALQRMLRNLHKAAVAGGETNKPYVVPFVGAEKFSHAFLVKIVCPNPIIDSQRFVFSWYSSISFLLEFGFDFLQTTFEEDLPLIGEIKGRKRRFVGPR